MAPADSRKLKTRAADAFRRGRHRRALKLYLDLEAREPNEVTWPYRQAEIHRRRGDAAQELEALERCAAIHAGRGFAIKAIAICKRILELEPSHTATQDRLAELQREGRAAPPPPEAASAPASAREAFGALSQRRPAPPLEELLLSEVVAEARPACIHTTPQPGIAEIPLDAPPEAGGAGVASAAAERLRDTPLLGGLDASSLRRTIERLRRIDLREGEVLFREGDPPGALFVVADGAVVPVADGNPPRKLAVLEQGDFFGEVALLTDQPRNASVRALVDSQLLAIDRPLVWELVEESPAVLSVLLRFVRERLVDRLVRTSPVFRSLSLPDRRDFAAGFRLLEARAGESFIDQGQLAEALFVLCAGSAEAVFADPEGSKLLGRLEPGDVFGEMSLLHGEPCLASVTAGTKCWALALPKHRFRQALKQHPDLSGLLQTVAEERERRNQSTLRGASAHRDERLDWL